MKKYFFSAVVACIMSVMPAIIKAAEAYAALSDDNTILTFYYDNEKSSRNGMDIGPFENKKDREWHNFAGTITTVVFDNSFAQETSLTSTAYWFQSLGELTTIIGIEYLNTNNVTDMKGMFGDCTSLKSIDLSHFNTEKVETMCEMFIECESLTTLDLRSFDTGNVKDMSMMFAGCNHLIDLDVSSFNTENAIETWSMFEDCKALTKLNVSSFNTKNVQNLSYMFGDCFSLETLDLSNFDTSNVTNMNCLFQDCYVLTTVFVSDLWNTSKVEKGERVFNKCPNLVGGSGTVYDENHTDYTYAHIDGGASNPGYLTSSADVSKKEGDTNGDGTVNAVDIVEIVNLIRGLLSDESIKALFDVNGDGVVTIADIIVIVNIINNM